MLLRAVLPRAQVSPTDVFVDIGSGKGRILLEAATRYRFRRIIGVELLPALTATAARNHRTTRRRLRTPEVELVTGDAREWVPPDDLTIAYMVNPFVARCSTQSSATSPRWSIDVAILSSSSTPTPSSTNG
jgi:tRNA1(Val) A37 N6-methylase TrmN6